MSGGDPKLPENTQEPKSIWSRSFIILFFANMAFNMGLYLSNSLISLYADSLGASAAVVGLVVSSFGISSVLFRLISSPIMDTYNRKHLVILASLMLSAAFWGYSISYSIPMLICFRVLQGCALAFGNACCLAMVADMLPKEKYNSGLGYYSLAQVTSQAIGPSIGLELVNLTGFQTTYMLNACLMILSAVLACLVKSSYVPKGKLKLTLSNIIAKEALIPAGFHFLVVFAAAGSTSFLFLFAGELEIKGNIGLYYTVTAITMLVIRPLIGKLADRLGIVKIAVPAVFCSVLALFIVSWSNTLTGFLIGAFVSAFGPGAYGPAIQALTMKSVPGLRRGSASSTVFIAQDTGSMIGVIVAGQIVQSFGYAAMWQLMAIPFVLGALLLVLYRFKIARIEEEFAKE